MSEQGRSPHSSPLRPRLTTRRLVLLFAAASLLGFSSAPRLLGRTGSFVIEIALVALGALLALQAGHAWLAAPSQRRLLRVLVVLVGSIALGQIVREKKLFPLMPYTMYGRAPEGDVEFYEYEARHRSGARGRFRPSTVIATLGRARIVKGLARELDAAAEREANGRPADLHHERLRNVMATLVAHENRSHPSDPVMQVDVVQVVLPAPYEPRGARRRLVTTLSFDGAR